MKYNTSTRDKPRGRGASDDRPATVWLDNGAQFHVDHHFVAKDGSFLHLVLDRSASPAGIDMSVPLQQVAAVQRSDRDDVDAAATTAVNGPSHEKEKKVIVLIGHGENATERITDAILDELDVDSSASAAANMGIKPGDVVTVRDEDGCKDPDPWKVREIQDGMARLWAAHKPLRHERVEDLTVVEKADETTPPHSTGNEHTDAHTQAHADAEGDD